MLLASCATTPAAHVADGLDVTGALPAPRTYSQADLLALGPVDGRWNDHGTEHAFRGVPLGAVLVASGFDRGAMGPDVPKPRKVGGWKKVVVASAADGFQAVFSCAEVTDSMGPSRAFVVWEMDGAPLPAGQGPLRLVVTTDLQAGRAVRELRRLDVVDLASDAGR